MDSQNGEELITTNLRKPDIVDFHNKISEWLTDPSESFYKNNNDVRLSQFTIYLSPKTKPTPSVSGNIVIVQQYYVPNNKKRHEEIKLALMCNCNNDAIDRIVLLNERIYSDDELGITNDKIEQIDISHRITYRDVFEFSNKLSDDSYIVLANADIFFDTGIGRVRESGLVVERKAFTQLRHEFSSIELKDCKLFGPRLDSQDTWIWNSKWKIPNNILKLFNLEMGIPGCDNKMIYLLAISGFNCHNEPEWIKCYHNHNSNLRGNSYLKKKVNGPYYGIYPNYGSNSDDYIGAFNPKVENAKFRDYITSKNIDNKPFIIPRMAGIENELVAIGAIVIQNKNVSHKQLDLINKIVQTMKNNAGIKVTDINSVCNYSSLYLSAFNKCDLYLWWAPWGNVSVHIPHSWDFIVNNFKGPKIDALSLDIFNNIHNDPWTLALKGKRILIISSFIDSIKEKIDIRDKIYGIDLFPNCEFVFIKPPQTHGSNESREFNVEFAEFVERVRDIKDTFDVALCSCGGYGNPICSAIYDMDKSAIYVGGVLQMYFGIYGERWMREHPDVLRAYMNEHWSRPKETEKPRNHKQVENSCYW